MDVDQSLDAIIKATKPTGRGGGGGGRGGGGRASRGGGRGNGGGRGRGGRSARPSSSGGAGAKTLKAALAGATSGRGRGGGGRASRGRGATATGRGRGRDAGKSQQTKQVPAGRWAHDKFSGPKPTRGRQQQEQPRRTLAPAGRRQLRSAAQRSNNNSNNNNNNNYNNNFNNGPELVNLKTKAKKAPPMTTGTVLRVTNLDDGVTASDMKELFELEGSLKKVVMTSTHCDVTFQRKDEASAAMQKFNGVTLDGQQMKIRILSSLGGRDKGDVKFTVTL